MYSLQCSCQFGWIKRTQGIIFHLFASPNQTATGRTNCVPRFDSKSIENSMWSSPLWTRETSRFSPCAKKLHKLFIAVCCSLDLIILWSLAGQRSEWTEFRGTMFLYIFWLIFKHHVSSHQIWHFPRHLFPETKRHSLHFWYFTNLRAELSQAWRGSSWLNGVAVDHCIS